MPIIEVQMMEGRTTEQKCRMAAAITEAVSRTLECSADTVRILITELTPDGFFVGGQTMAQRKAGTNR